MLIENWLTLVCHEIMDARNSELTDKTFDSSSPRVERRVPKREPGYASNFQRDLIIQIIEIRFDG